MASVLAKYQAQGSPLLSGYLLGEKSLQGQAAALDVRLRQRPRRPDRLPPAVARPAVRHVPRAVQRRALPRRRSRRGARARPASGLADDGRRSMSAAPSTRRHDGRPVADSHSPGRLRSRRNARRLAPGSRRAANALVARAGRRAVCRKRQSSRMVGEGAAVLVRRALAASGLEPDTPGALDRFLAIYDTLPAGSDEAVSWHGRNARTACAARTGSPS